MSMTKNLRIHLEYLCWRIQFWMSGHKPYYPLWLRMFLLSRFPETRHFMDWITYNNWLRTGWQPKPEYRPLPWFVGEAAIGPLVKPWSRVGHFFRAHTGGRSHRCEFTDRRRGALYGGQDGAFMNKLFDQFIENISGDGD